MKNIQNVFEKIKYLFGRGLFDDLESIKELIFDIEDHVKEHIKKIEYEIKVSKRKGKKIRK